MAGRGRGRGGGGGREDCSDDVGGRERGEARPSTSLRRR